MEGLRGVAVILVFFVHFATLCEPYLGGATLSLAEALLVLGDTGVDLFFVLSGYLIYGTLLRRPRPFVGFMARRVQRLYPTFMVVLAAYLALSLALPSESKLPVGIWAMLAYVAANFLLLPGMLDIRPIITVAWSLSYEMFFYLSVPLLISVLHLRSWPMATRVGAFLVAVAVAQALHLPHDRIGMFACGMVLAELLPAARRVFRDSAVLDALAIAAVPACGAVLLAEQVPPAARFAAIFSASFLLCLASFARNGMVARAMTVAPLRWLGNMSYSYYLLHALVLKATFFALGVVGAHRLGDSTFFVLLPPAFALTLIGSAVLFILVERPLSVLPGEAGRGASYGSSRVSREMG